ncbi:glycosyltransferase family 2 protein [Wenzhouxiangella sp. AB-CW3]|uniref:glycosyltransferase family 2 protein n=1 Tax=Wenzhouxiangella sp. AB-CW3 TaxID=2771012 RepID=UPI00168BF9B6|nr:glycosyltransferase family 2 protein [Wenzhouxiangella sp. AB-CW3]QOC21895.1 glycosyltransferase family 2 protein [Wenzhouxiangella sp. AB-CW3]
MNQPARRVSVIIPNWNGAHHLPGCLDSLDQQRFRDFDVILVDNGSEDDSLALVERDYPWVRIVRNHANLGFSAAVNAGIRVSSSEFLALLNNDTRADPGWLERLVDAMDATPGASFAACKMLRFDPPHRIDSAGDRFSIWRGGGINIGAGEPAEHHSEPAWVFGACAGAALYRCNLFDDIGPFDEDFFLVFEDIDIDLRAQVAGHRCLYVPDAVVYHKRGASTDVASALVTTRSLRNMIWAAGKNLPPALLLLWLVCFGLRLSWTAVQRIVLMPLRRIRRRLSPRDRRLPQSNTDPEPELDFRLALRALTDGFGQLPRRRRNVRALRRLGSRQLWPVLIRPVQGLGD